MAVVEANFLDNNEAKEVPDCDQEGGQLVATLVATPHGQRIHDHVVEWTNHEYVQSYQLDSLLVFLPTNLHNYACTYTRPRIKMIQN